MDSGSLAGSYHASCASDQEESTFLKRIRYLRWVRIGLAILILGLAVSIVGCQVVPYRHYQKTSAYGGIGLYLWPVNFDLRPTIALLACGCVIAFLSMLFIVVSLLPSPRSHITRVNAAAVATSAAGFITALVGVVFVIYLPGSSHPDGFGKSETLHSWTCKWKVSHAVPSVLAGTVEVATPPPAYFARDCAASQAAFVLLGLLIGFEIIMGVAAGVGAWFEMSVAKQRGVDRAQLEKIEMMVKHGH